MKFLEKLDFLMADQGMTKSTLSQISGVPYTTIDGFYKKGYENAKISTIRKIARAFGVSLDYLIEDAPRERGWLREDEKELIRLYNSMNEEGRGHLIKLAGVLSTEYIKNSAIPAEA